MEYVTALRASVSLWHPTLKVSELEQAFGDTAAAGHDAGSRRTKGDLGPYAETMCAFDVFDGQADFSAIVAICSKRLLDFLGVLPDFSNSGGMSWIIVAVTDANFIQLDLTDEVIESLRAARTNLSIENRT